ncbi:MULTISPECIES: sulfur carrier protein ThiS [Parapedobacter]|nr:MULTISPECIES: sulfur carrier protein ThiS [Parapedobacter]
MEVIINHQTVVTKPEAPLSEVLRTYGVVHAKGVAVAVNETIIPQSHWNTKLLEPRDRIMVIKAAQGG